MTGIMHTYIKSLEMKSLIFMAGAVFSVSVSAQSADEIMDRVDRNMSSENRVFESTMVINGKRNSRTITSRSYSVGDEKAFTEYLSPAREQGTKMLKLEDQLWIYSPSTDRTIQISGHMLRQSVMGSDLSYEDMMEDRKLTDIYDATVAGSDELNARVADVAYASRKVWIDKERFVPLKEELYAKSGQLLKRSTLGDVIQVQGRWFPTTVVYKDMLKQGDGTEFRITSIKFNQQIEEYLFTKAALKQ
jgi:outer membrane lipoprotein-sorting protein